MSDVSKEFRELDESFIGYSDHSKPLVFHTNNMLVQHGFELPIRITHAGSTITYSFATVQGDVSFAAVFHSADGRPSETIIQPHRVPSDVENITGRFKAGREGTLVIKFDNSFSWFTPKYLSYSVEMHQPTHIAADTHRSAKSRSLLKAVVEEIPLIESRLVASASKAASTRAELTEMEAALKALSMQVEAKRSDLEEQLRDTIELENRLEACKERRAGLCLRSLSRELLAEVISYLLVDAAAAKATALVCKHWFSLCRKQPLYASLLQKFQVVFVLGGPGSGKGTNCAKIVDMFGYVHLSAGDLLREERQSGSELADMINTYIKEGLIVPAEVTVRLLRTAMESSGGRQNRFLVDGFPRDLANLQCWERDMATVAEVKFLLFLDCPQDVMLDRLLERGKTSGRSDDNRESIVKRFHTYEASTRPIIEHFRRIDKIRAVDSNRDPDLVFADVANFFK